MPSFEEKGMAKAAARRAAREAKILANGTGKVANGAGKMIGNGLFRLIILNPYIGLSLLGILLAFVIYTVYSVNSSLDKLLYQYTHLVDTSQQNSKSQFDKKLHYIKVNADGTTSVVIGLKSEIDAQQLQEAVDEAGGSDANAENSSDSAYDQYENVEITGDARTMLEIINSSEYALNSHFKQNYEQYGYVYDELLNAGISKNYAIGIIANLTSEGTAGMKQGAYTPIKKNELESIVQRVNSGGSNSVGIGLMQWTYSGYMPELLNRYNDGGVWNSDGTMNITKALKVETAWIVEKARNNYTTASTICDGNPLKFAEYWCDYEERPAGCCGSGKRMTTVGASCQKRVNRAKIIVNGMR